jgi:hypothetical protein
MQGQDSNFGVLMRDLLVLLKQNRAKQGPKKKGAKNAR